MKQLILMLVLRTTMPLTLSSISQNLQETQLQMEQKWNITIVATAVPLKYLINFRRSLEMPLVNCKVELKLKQTNSCVLMLILVILFLLSNTQNYMSLSSLYQQKTIKNYQNFLVKDLKDQCVATNIKQKVRTKVRQMSVDIFSNQTLQVLTDCLS